VLLLRLLKLEIVRTSQGKVLIPDQSPEAKKQMKQELKQKQKGK
jgi:hypothetical protein